jgi:transposase
MSVERRNYSPEFKFQCVLELIGGKKTMSQLCREHNIKDSVISRWREQLLEHGHELFNQQNKKPTEEARIAELERLVGQMTIQLEAAKKVSNWLKCQ